MDRVPFEILYNILDFLETPFAQYAPVSNTFQKAVETKTFAKIKTSSAEQSLRELDDIFKDTRRRYLVREFEYAVILPNVSKKRFKKLQSDRESLGNNIIYTKAIDDLFARLKQWTAVSDDLDRVPSFRLAMSSASPRDDYRPKSPNQHAHDPAWEIRNNFRYLQVDQGLKLPLLMRVDEFSHSGRNLHPDVISVISAALPRMKKLSWELHATPRRLRDLRVDIRSSTASVLLNTEFPHLEVLDIYNADEDPLNQDWKPETYLSESEHDNFSLAVNSLSRLRKLKSLNLFGVNILSPSVFDIDDENKNAWKCLERLQLDVSRTTPDGRWYFTGNRESAAESNNEIIDSDSEASIAEFDSDDSNSSDFLPRFRWDILNGDIPWVEFRYHPDPITLNPFLIAMVRAIIKMPALKHFTCQFNGAAFIEYIGPGMVVNSPVMAVERVRFLSSNLRHGRWIMVFDTERHSDDRDIIPSDWVIPREVIEILEAANHRMVLTHGNLCFGEK